MRRRLTRPEWIPACSDSARVLGREKLVLDGHLSA
jgi:hypothetical protein